MSDSQSQVPAPEPLIQPSEPPPAISPAKKSNRNLFLVIGGVILVICICLSACLVLGGTSFIKAFQEKAPIEKVIDSFMRTMVEKDTEKAFALFSARARRQLEIESLGKMLEGNNYVLFDGYQKISIQNLTFNTGFNTNPDVPQGFVAKVTGTITYDGGFTGSFNATLEKEGDQWYLDAINITVPPDKFQP